MTDEVSLSQATRRNQCHIIPVGQQVYKPPSLIHAVTEVMLTRIAIGHKWIFHIAFALILAAKIQQIHKLS
jgi:hypothetical protein